MSTNEKYYSGFEGDEEIVLRLYIGGKETEFLGVWGGWFNGIMKTIEPEKSGWTALALPYHLTTGWYEEENWLVPDLSACLEQLAEIDRRKLRYHEENEVLDQIIDLFRRAIETGGEIKMTSY